MEKSVKTVCIKIGGSTFDTPGLMEELAESVHSLLPSFFPLIVHGGGKDIGRELDRLNKTFTFIDGMRVTDSETMRVVQMVLSGDLNKRLVSALLTKNVASLGISGVDCNLIQASKLVIEGRDLGYVGKIEKVNRHILDICKKSSIVPVISPVSRDLNGVIYNVNADVVASEIAIEIKASHLIFISDVPGVKIGTTVAREIKISEIEYLIEQGHVSGGMIPKLRSAAEAVTKGVGRVHICCWHGPQTLAQELKVSTSCGTVIY